MLRRKGNLKEAIRLLSLKQERFVEEYLLNGGNAASAARKAGYSAKNANVTGAQLLSNANIRAAIDARLEATRTGRTAATAELMEFLSSVVRGEISDEIYLQRLVGKGVQCIEKFNPRPMTRERIKAAEILLKVHGAFKEKVEIQTDAATEFRTALERIWAADTAATESVHGVSA